MTTRPTEFQNFRDLTRRILTTPKAELMKSPEKKPAKRPAKKKR